MSFKLFATIGIVLIILAIYILTRKREVHILVCFDEFDFETHDRIVEITQSVSGFLGTRYRRDEISRTMYVDFTVDAKNADIIYKKLKRIEKLEVIYV